MDVWIFQSLLVLDILLIYINLFSFIFLAHFQGVPLPREIPKCLKPENPKKDNIKEDDPLTLDFTEQNTDEKIDEDEQLENELVVLENAEKLKELTGSVAWTLNNDDESILNTLSQLKMNLSKASRMDSELEDSESELINIIESIKDLSSSLKNI